MLKIDYDKLLKHGSTYLLDGSFNKCKLISEKIFEFVSPAPDNSSAFFLDDFSQSPSQSSKDGESNIKQKIGLCELILQSPLSTESIQQLAHQLEANLK